MNIHGKVKIFAEYISKNDYWMYSTSVSTKSGDDWLSHSMFVKMSLDAEECFQKDADLTMNYVVCDCEGYLYVREYKGKRFLNLFITDLTVEEVNDEREGKTKKTNKVSSKQIQKKPRR